MIKIYFLAFSFFMNKYFGIGEECHRFHVEKQELHPKIVFYSTNGMIKEKNPSLFGYEHKCKRTGNCAIAVYFCEFSSKQTVSKYFSFFFYLSKSGICLWCNIQSYKSRLQTE